MALFRFVIFVLFLVYLLFSPSVSQSARSHSGKGISLAEGSVSLNGAGIDLLLETVTRSLRGRAWERQRGECAGRARSSGQLMPALYVSACLARASADRGSQAGKSGINHEMFPTLFSYSRLICSVRLARSARKPGRNKLAFYAMLGFIFKKVHSLLCRLSFYFFP